MKIRYDKQTDVLYIRFSDAPVAESDGDKKGIILDYDAEANVVGIELLEASKKITDPDSLEYIKA